MFKEDHQVDYLHNLYQFFCLNFLFKHLILFVQFAQLQVQALAKALMAIYINKI